MIKKTNFTQKAMKLPQVALESVMQICAAYDKWGEFLVGGVKKNLDCWFMLFTSHSPTCLRPPSPSRSCNDDGVAHNRLIIVCFGVDFTSCPEAKGRAPCRPAQSRPVSKATVR